MRGAYRVLASALFAIVGASAAQLSSAQPQPLPTHIQLLRDIYKELIEINTTDSVGETTRAATAMAVRLRAAGFAASDVQLLVPPGGPKKGNLVARLRGTGARKPLLLLAHLDVVEAKREDWDRDPFTLIEEGGYFYARGAADDKAMAAVFVANLIRYKQEGYVPDRDLVLALTADEEKIPSEFNGVEWLLKRHRNLVDAEYALNEGGTGLIDKSGRYLRLGVQAGEKVFQSYRLEVHNAAGGHSSLPSKDNAIYHLADGLSRLGTFDFPFKLSDITRAYFERVSDIESGQLAVDMKAITRDPPDSEAIGRLTQIPLYNAQFRTTCVATMLEGGHATNALPQAARAIVNCRVLPGESVEEVEKTLVRVLADDQIRITPLGEPTLSPPPPLNPEIMRPVEEITPSMWPGVPVVPTMLAAATDGRFLNNAGIATYGISGMFRDADNSRIHGLNERLRVTSLYEGQEFLYRLVKALSSPK